MEKVQKCPSLRRSVEVLILAVFGIAFGATPSPAQSYVDIDSLVKVKYDGEVAKTIQLEASLTYGFAYRVPIQIEVTEGVEISSLHGSSICNCVSFSIKNGHVMDTKAPGKGFLLIRPKSEDLFQVIDIMGTRAGEVDPHLIAKIKVACEVFHPIKISPEIIEVKNHRLLTTDLKVEAAQDVSILDVQIADSNSILDVTFDPKTQRVSISDRELPVGIDSGQIIFQFNLSLKGVKTQYDSIVAYESKKPLRLVPKTLTFRNLDKKCEARFVIIGFSLSQREAPTLLVEQESGSGNWTLIEANVRIDNFGFGKAVGKLSIEQDSIDFEKDKIAKLRFRNEDWSLVLEDVRAVLVR